MSSQLPLRPISNTNRRQLLASGATAIAALATARTASLSQAMPTNPVATPSASELKFGLVTYQWGKDMTLPDVIAACQAAEMGGVELRTEHRHRVEPSLSKTERSEVKKRFADSGIELIGYGSNCEFHSADPAVVKKNIEQAKELIHLMHDCGGSGVKVKPNAFVNGIPQEKTVEQIGKALQELAEYGEGYGQQIRLEVHGAKTSRLEVIRDIFQIAVHPNAAVCWNSNKEDLVSPGLEANFGMVKSRLGDTTHVRKLDDGDYPYVDLFALMLRADYPGWVLLEAHSNPEDKVAAMKQQTQVFRSLLASAREKLATNQP
ncbi:sugar phosphate isomerase/epimerase family protein [Pirellulaceae bacterium SH501]